MSFAIGTTFRVHDGELLESGGCGRAEARVVTQGRGRVGGVALVLAGHLQEHVGVQSAQVRGAEGFAVQQLEMCLHGAVQQLERPLRVPGRQPGQGHVERDGIQMENGPKANADATLIHVLFSAALPGRHEQYVSAGVGALDFLQELNLLAGLVAVARRSRCARGAIVRQEGGRESDQRTDGALVRAGGGSVVLGCVPEPPRQQALHAQLLGTRRATGIGPGSALRQAVRLCEHRGVSTADAGKQLKGRA